MPKFAMPSAAKMRKVCKEAKRKKLGVLAETSRLDRFFSAKLSSSNVEAVVLTRAPENVGKSRHKLRSTFHIQRGWPYWHVIFQVFLFVISGFLLFGWMSFLAESLSNPVVLKVGGIAPLGSILMGKGAKKTKGVIGGGTTQAGTKTLDH